MLLTNAFHTDEKGHDHVPFTSPGFPCTCIYAELEAYPERSVAWHWHSSCEIVYVDRGSIELHTPDQVYALERGDAAFVNAGVLHSYLTRGDRPASQYALLFHMDFLSGAGGSVFEEKYFQPVIRCAALQARVISPDSREHLRMISAVMDAIELLREEPEGFEFDLRERLCGFWRGLYDETAEIRAAAPRRSTLDQERIKQMLDFIQAHFAEPLTVNQIAAAAGISPRECSRCFRRAIGASPIEHLTDYRIRAAATMLKETGMTVTEVSEACGFSAPSYFTRVFREAMGCTPKAWQRRFELAES